MFLPQRDAETSALDVQTSAFGLDAETSAIERSYRRYRRGVSGDCGVGITPQMCNRVTNHGDMSTFSKPGIAVQLFKRAMNFLYFFNEIIEYNVTNEGPV